MRAPEPKKETADEITRRIEERYRYPEKGEQSSTAAFVSERRYELASEFLAFAGDGPAYYLQSRFPDWCARRFGAVLAQPEAGILLFAIQHTAFPKDPRFQGLAVPTLRVDAMNTTPIDPQWSAADYVPGE